MGGLFYALSPKRTRDSSSSPQGLFRSEAEEWSAVSAELRIARPAESRQASAGGAQKLGVHRNGRLLI